MMQKVRNVIKGWCVLFILFFILILPAQQKMNGTYSIIDGTGYFFTNYSFNTKGIFTYEEGGDLGIDKHGKAHYQIKNDSLFLSYDLTALKEESYHKHKKYYNLTDSIQVKLRAYNFNKEPLYNMKAWSFPEHKTNEKGEALLKFKKGTSKDQIELHIDDLFWAEQIIFLNSDTNYNIDVFMNASEIQGFEPPKAIKNQVIKYQIIEHSEEYIKLKSKKQLLKLIKQTA